MKPKCYPHGSPAPKTPGTVLYQFAAGANVLMMGYLLKTAGGKLYVIDGGQKECAEPLLRFARELQGTEEGAPLRVDGWFLTHPHDDHIGAFWKIVTDHAAEVGIGKLYYHFPRTAYQEQYEPGDAATSREFDAIRAQIAPFAAVVHPGDVIGDGDARFEILTEPDERITVNTGNNSSVAIRLTAGGTRVLFLGDMGVEEGEAFLAAYGEDALRADLVEMAHHGQNGVGFPVYDAVRPRGCLWCTPNWLWRNDAGNGYGTAWFKTHAVRCYMADLGVKQHFVMKDGIWEIPLPFDEE